MASAAPVPSRSCWRCDHYVLESPDAQCDALGARVPWEEMTKKGGACAGERAPLWRARSRWPTIVLARPQRQGDRPTLAALATDRAGSAACAALRASLERR